jgi:hypothetical protein
MSLPQQPPSDPGDPSARLALHAFRRRVKPSARACPVTTASVDEAGKAMGELVETLSRLGRRRLKVGEPGRSAQTPDEQTLLAALAAAQAEDRDALEAALRWLFGREPVQEALEAVHHAAATFALAGWTWERPPARRGMEPPFGQPPVRAVR